MQQVALHTTLRPDAIEDYEAAHRRVPDALATALRRAGVQEWRIWRDGTDLFHLVDVEDYRAMRRALAEDPVNQQWQRRLRPFFTVADDYSGTDDGLRLLWALGAQDADGEPAT